MGDSDEELALMGEVENLSIQLSAIGHTLDAHFKKIFITGIESKPLADRLRKWRV
jgi:hypothetical protein